MKTKGSIPCFLHVHLGLQAFTIVISPWSELSSAPLSTPATHLTHLHEAGREMNSFWPRPAGQSRSQIMLRPATGHELMWIVEVERGRRRRSPEALSVREAKDTKMTLPSTLV